ncbi:hypothetical protein BDZ89DRAFT_1074890, partial [Hymenopellis radicata]
LAFVKPDAFSGIRFIGFSVPAESRSYEWDRRHGVGVGWVEAAQVVEEGLFTGRGPYVCWAEALGA